MRTSKYRYFVGDFETTVYENQDETEVWASACVELFTENVVILNSIEQQYNYFIALDCNICCYYHNLKFDGAFWLDYLMKRNDLNQAYSQTGDKFTDVEFIEPRKMKNNTFQYSISNMGQWYRIMIKINNRTIEIRDSLKLLPFSVRTIGKSFGTKHKKLDMEYKGHRYAGCEITAKEKEYIANDVLVVKEALEIMFNEGHNKLTIGSCCLAEYKNIIGKETYNTYYPDVYLMDLDKEYGALNIGEYIKKSYRGGWCYLVKGKENQIKSNGLTADVNSLYPSMMSSESGNAYPVGKPTFWRGNFIPPIAKKEGMYYFVRIKTKFRIKEGMLPFIQIKGNLMYKSTEMLTTSEVFDIKTGKHYSKYRTIDGEIKDTFLTMTMTMTDYELFLEHYIPIDMEILDGCYFHSEIGIFDHYIEKYKQIKLNSKGALRQLAKLFLNNLYGKMAASTDSSFKFAYLKDDGVVGLVPVTEHNKQAGYIPVGSAITSYARNFTIRAAQKNYHGVDKRGFIYADTDSIHCDLQADEIKGINVHDKNFCCWKLESSWDKAIFVRQKTYIEHIVGEDLEPIENPYYSVKCAGMPDKCKNLFIKSMDKDFSFDGEDNLTEEEKIFITKKRTMEDFKIGLKVSGKLIPKRIKGGIVLQDSYYEMR